MAGTRAAPRSVSFGRNAALVAAVLGWLFDGFEIGLFPLVGPRALDDLGLLPMEMPALVRRADQLATRARPLPGVKGPSKPISRLTGALRVSR